jgi:hypothetical protein
MRLKNKHFYFPFISSSFLILPFDIIEKKNQNKKNQFLGDQT